MSPKNTRARVLPANHTHSAEESNGRLNLLSQIDRSSVLRKMFKTASTDMVRPPFKMNGITYCIGDIVKFHHDNPTAELPNAWLGLLVDYSAGNPRATPTSKVIHPGEGKTVDLVAMCWFYSQSDVEDLVNGRIDLHPDIVYKGKTRGKIQFEAQFFDADNYDNVRFPCNEVEWTLVDGLLGLASPDEVGDGMDSNRAVTVPFRGPWLGVQHLVLDVKATAKRKAYQKEVHEVSIITEPNVGLPDGFVEEIKEEVKEDE